MEILGPSARRIHRHLRCALRDVRCPALLSGAPARSLSASASPGEAASVQAEAPKKKSAKWTWDPKLVVGAKDEQHLMRRRGVQPVGSRRRRAALRNTARIPFEQLPYQCFQEARKILLEDRKEKVEQIEVQKLRIANLRAQDAAVSGGEQAKEVRLMSMTRRLEEMVVLADINDPVVKKRFEDGKGDMNKPIYRYLADRKWRKYKRLVIEQRVQQMHIVPDVLPSLDPTADVDLSFGRRRVQPGEFIHSLVSAQVPRMRVQVFDKGERLISVVVVDADVPVPEKDSFTYRCHFIACNIPISPTQPLVPLDRLDQASDDADAAAKPKHIALPWLPPWAHQGAPYHRIGVFVLHQTKAKPLDTAKLAKATQRHGFILRSFIQKNGCSPIGFAMFRTHWDDGMPKLLERIGLGDQAHIQFKRKRYDPLPQHRRSKERMRG